ncbi:ATP-grasp domain-containing protein [Herbiconiux liangxiaofengii]|uniref:ATP-grasp domain-containing protein n=1 Tax=Herbiconiux liangxiaofengii TaxID=3342795 RepID=UPI0035B6B70B
MSTVLLTGSRAPATLDLARHFAASGATVVTADSQPAIASASNAVSKAYRVPSPRFSPVAFVDAVAGIARRHAVDLVVPTCEEIFWLAAGVDSRPGPSGWGPLDSVLFAPPIDVLRRLHDKAEFRLLLAELGVPHPSTEVIDSRIVWRRMSRDTSRRTRRVVLKPAFSRFGTRTRIVDPGDPLPEPERITPEQRWLVQEHIEGEEFCTYAVAVEGRLTAFAAYRPVWRAGRGASVGAGVAFERLDPSRPEVVAAHAIAARLAGALGLTGQFGLDLMHRPSTPATPVIVLECNPRATSGIHLFAPADGLAAAFRGRPPAPRDAPDGADPRVTRAAAPSGPVVAPSRSGARLGVPHLLYAGPAIRSATTARRFVGQLRSPDALRPPSDRLPVTALLRALSVQAAEARAAHTDLLAASTLDLEWNGEHFPEPARRSRPARDPLWAARFVEAVALEGGPTAIAANTGCRLDTVTVGDHSLPVTVSTSTSTPRQEAARSYVVSPLTHYVHYAREELVELPSMPVRRAAGGLLRVLEVVLRAGRVDDVVIVGNSLVSTNLLPELDEAAVADVTARLTAAHPDAAVAWRSVHGRGTTLPDVLRRAGYRLLPSRSVLFAPTRGDEWMTLRDVRRDRGLFETSGHRAQPAPVDPVTGMSSPAIRQRIADLYGLLYLGKYSRLNPAYTAAFVGAAQRSGFLRFTLLTRPGRPSTVLHRTAAPPVTPADIVGVIGTSTAHGLLAAPVFGYDTTLPVEEGLYRMLSWLVARQAHEEGVDLHASSGVADFKRNRGAERELEYLAVYTRHLPWRRRMAWSMLQAVLERIAMPLVERHTL